MKRADINSKYKWDLSLIFDSDKSFFDSINKLTVMLKELVLYKGKLNTKHNIIEYLKKDAEFEKLLSRCYLYASLKVSADTSDANNLSQMAVVENLFSTISEKLSFVSPELASLDVNFLNELKNDDNYKDYSRVFESVLRYKPHTLDEQSEKLLAGIGSFTDFDQTFSMLDDVEIKMDDVVVDNKTYKLDNASYGLLIRDGNPDVRFKTHYNLHKAFSNYNLTISQNYLNQVKKSDYFARSYNYKSSFCKAMFTEEVDKNVYELLIKSVHSSLPLFYKFAELKRQLLGLDKIGVHDMYAPIIKDVPFNKSYEQAYALVVKALAVLGKDYTDVLERAFNNRWIDVFANDGKRGGAFSTSAETGNPFVMLNYNQTYNDISTIAHELGHAMHSYYSEKYQPHEKCDYVIFVAEVASTVNEILLADYVLNNTTDKNVKKFLICSLLEDFYATVFRQTMFSEFEYKVHSAINNKEPLTFKELNDIYNDLLNQYFGDNVYKHEYAKYEWSRIPHFYRPFYVYKYATGFISAIAIVNNIKNNGHKAVEDYKEFLKSGCKTDPVSLLKIAGVDISDKSTFDSAFKFYDSLINDLQNL